MSTVGVRVSTPVRFGMSKLSLCMIVKDGLDDLKRLKPLVEPYIDEWVVVFPPGDKAIPWAKKNGIKTIVKDFTQEIDPKVLEVMADEYDEHFTEGYRVFNFAAARNESFKHATSDYLMWLDADDNPVGMNNLLELINKGSYEVYNCVYDYFKDEEGNSIADHVRERVVKRDSKLTWKGGKLGLIHETLVSEPGYSPSQIDISKDIFYIQHTSTEGQQSSDRNFIALLYEYIATKGEDPRTIYYLGVELFNHQKYEHCVKVMLEYTRKGGWDEERYRAWMRAGEAYDKLGDRESSRNAYLSGTKELPEYPDAYLNLGESYFYEGDYGKAISFTTTGLQKPVPATKSPLDRVRYTYRPAGHMALAYLQLGKMDEAHEWFQRAKKLNPRHSWIAEHSKLFEDAKDLDDYVKSFVKLGQLSQKLYPKTLSKLAEAIPEELKDQELLMDFKWRYTTPKIWSDKSVVFFCSSVIEDWGPESLETGCGGSEEAVIQLSKRLVKLGWEVTIYNNCIKEGVVDGVNWIRFERFNPRDMFNILVSWRSNIFPLARSAVKRYVDLHDVPDNKDLFTLDNTAGVKMLAKSQFHRSLFPRLPDDRFVIIPNGIDTNQFPIKNVLKQKNALVWTSSYDRGLEYLLEMWPDILEEVPGATLDVYYGFDLFDKTPRGKSNAGKMWKAKMLELLQQKSVVEHGRVGSKEVAKAYLGADVFAYPSDFPEIDFISLTKAQAAKMVPITTSHAVLTERNQGILIEGDIHDSTVREEFKRELIALLKDNDRKQAIRDKLDVGEYDWDTVVSRWSEEFKS